MKVFKKDGMLTKPAEKHVRTARNHGAHLVGEAFDIYFWHGDDIYRPTVRFFRFREDGSIQTLRSTGAKWTLCAKPPQGDITQ